MMTTGDLIQFLFLLGAASWLITAIWLLVQPVLGRHDFGACAGCGYSLRGLADDARCPECDGLARQTSAPRCVGRVLRMLAAALCVEWFAVFVLVAVFSGGALSTTMFIAGFLFMPGGAAQAILMLLAAWRLRYERALVLVIVTGLSLLMAAAVLVLDTEVWHPDAQGGIVLVVGGIMFVPAAVGLGATGTVLWIVIGRARERHRQRRGGSGGGGGGRLAAANREEDA